MGKGKEFMIDDTLVTASDCTFEEYKDSYGITSNEYSDDRKGYNVIFSITGVSVFIPNETFKAISQPSEY